MSAAVWDQGDLYTRVSDPSGKRAPYVQHHVAWNMSVLLGTLQAQHQDPTIPAEDRFKVERVTRHDYEVYKGYKRFSKDLPRG